MSRLRFYQDTFWFFLIVIFLTQAGVFLYKTRTTPSNPLTVVHPQSQGDGGSRETTG